MIQWYDQFNFSEKGLGLVFSPHFVYDISRKMFLILHSINWPNFIVRWPLLLEILGNKRITIACLPGCVVIKFEINLIFLIKLFCCITKRSRQKVKNILRTKRTFDVKNKHFSSFFKGFQLIVSELRVHLKLLNQFNFETN